MKHVYPVIWPILSGLLVFLTGQDILWAQTANSSGPPALIASVEPSPAPFGSIATLSLSYRLPPGARLPDTLELTGLEGLTVLGRKRRPGQITVKLLIDNVDSWETGPFSVAYVDQEGQKQVLTSDTVSMEVLSNLGKNPEEAELQPIQGIMPTKSQWPRYALWATCGLAVLLATAGFFWWYKKRPIQALSAEALVPPHRKARKEIEQLEAQGLFEQGQIKEFYFRFSEILRQYLGALRDFPAAEYTTEEIALHLRDEQDRKLLPLLRHADLVKFADTVPTPARKDEELSAALSYIQQTGKDLEHEPSGHQAQGDAP